MSISISRGDNGLLYIGLPYIQDLVDKIKTVEGRTWVPNIKQWTVPDTRKAIQELAAVFAGEHISVAAFFF